MPRLPGRRSPDSGCSGPEDHRHSSETLCGARERSRAGRLCSAIDFVLIAMRPKTEQVSNSREEPAQGIGKAKRLERAKFIALAEIKRSGMHVAALIESQDERAFEGRSVVRAGGMAKMMIEKEKRT